MKLPAEKNDVIKTAKELDYTSNVRDNIILVTILIISSLVIYYIQYLVFSRPDETGFLLFQDLAFLPIQVAIITLIINKFINILENRKKKKKVNVLISTFFVETGTLIIKAFSEFNCNNKEICNILGTIDKKNKNQIKTLIKDVQYDIHVIPEKLEELDILLSENKSIMLGLLRDTNLLEHDSFTDMLWAVFHVADELQSRDSLRNLPCNEIDHLSNDILRAYSAMVLEWINYMNYLRDEYPFLYVLSVKKNPFC